MTNFLRHDVAQMQIFEAVQACGVGWDAIDSLIEELKAYVEMTKEIPSQQRNSSFAFVLLQVLYMPTSERWLTLNHLAESHGMELYK